uniref:Uncharacterized protein n=1 Tax=Cucumis melo TaxID=3656 RepID=A0A9I9D423_CUCME
MSTIEEKKQKKASVGEKSVEVQEKDEVQTEKPVEVKKKKKDKVMTEKLIEFPKTDEVVHIS